MSEKCIVVDLEMRIATLERIIREMEAANTMLKSGMSLGMPPPHTDFQKPEGVCGGCGLVPDGQGGIKCSHETCPCGLGNN